VLFNGFLLAIGGYDGVSDLKTMEAYNHEKNSWRCVLYCHYLYLNDDDSSLLVFFISHIPYIFSCV